MENSLKYQPYIVSLGEKLGPGYTINVAFKDKESNKVYEGLCWLPEDEKYEVALAIEDAALEEKYHGQFSQHPDYILYIKAITKQIDRSEIFK